MTNALTEAQRLGLDTVQVFTKNQQQWKAKPLERTAIDEWRAQIKALGWQDRTVSHASYLINLASCNDELWEKSVSLMREEIERCEALGIPFLVHHPGSCVNSTRDAGIARIGDAYARLYKETSGYATVCCLEGTVGAGSTLGGTFEDLAELRELIASRTGVPARTGFCLDSCHLHAAGFDMSTRESASEVIERFDRTCGLTHLRVMHLNDSKGKLGSKLDRHEHIGQGWVGGGATAHTGVGEFSQAKLAGSGFAAIVNHPGMMNIPKILETPKEKDAQGVDMDLINVARLKGLIGLPGGRRAGEPARPSNVRPSTPAKGSSQPNDRPKAGAKVQSKDQPKPRPAKKAGSKPPARGKGR